MKDHLKNYPTTLYVAFRKTGDKGRCCTFDSVKELKENHPETEYDIVVYIRYDVAKIDE